MTLQERIPPIVYELCLTAYADNALDLVRGVLLSTGLRQDQLSEEEERGLPAIKVFFEDKVKINRLHTLFKRLNLAGIKVVKSTLRPEDWLTRWKREWRPARLTKKLDVVPVWCRKSYIPHKGRDYILMDTLLSFGTGLHETTRIISQFIEDEKGRFKTFMDIGTGTGILTIVAVKNGATKTLAIDIGDLSVEAAKNNMVVNGVKALIKKADIKIFRHAGRYDFVAANLITHDLIDNAPQILKYVKDGGYLAVSGISLDNLTKLRRVFNQLPLKFLKLAKGKQWSGLLFQKKTL